MNKNLKIALIGLSVVAVGVGGFLLFSKPKGKSTSSGSNGNYLDSEDVVNQDYFNPKSIANDLYQFMNEYSLGGGTNEGGIYEALSLLTQTQFKKIIDAFGKRNYNKLLGRDAPFGELRTLPQWLKLDLDDSEYKQLRQKFPKYL